MLPAFLLSKKHGPFSDASSIRSSFLKVIKMGNWLSPMSWILWGRGCSSWDIKCPATLRVRLNSLNFLCTSLHNTLFLVMKTWWRWSYNWSTSFSFSSVEAAIFSEVSSSKSLISSTIYYRNFLKVLSNVLKISTSTFLNPLESEWAFLIKFSPFSVANVLHLHILLLNQI